MVGDNVSEGKIGLPVKGVLICDADVTNSKLPESRDRDLAGSVGVSSVLSAGEVVVVVGKTSFRVTKRPAEFRAGL